MNKTLRTKVLVTLLFGFGATALADAWSTYSYNTYNAIPQIAFDGVTNSQKWRVLDGQGGGGGSGKSASAAATRLTLGYKPSGAVSNKVTNWMLADLAKQRNKTPAQIRSDMAAQIGPALPPELINRFLEKKGYTANNLTSYFNVYLAVSYNTIEGTPLTSSQEQAMYYRVRDILLPAFGASSDNTKQRLSEYMAWMAQIQYFQNKTNPSAAKKNALALLNQYGIDRQGLNKLAAP